MQPHGLQAPLLMGFPQEEYWSGLPFPSPGDLPNPRIEPLSAVYSALAGRFFTTSATWFLCLPFEIRFLKKKLFLLIWLHKVLVLARGI